MSDATPQALEAAVPNAQTPETSVAEDTVKPAVDVTHFNFDAKVFHVPGARFALTENAREPRFFVDLGGISASLSVDVLQKEFSIGRDSSDMKLIQIAVSGLRFVDDIRTGDAVPAEILNGSVSWPIKSKHKLHAARRLQVQLLSWVSGKELLLTNFDEIDSFLEQIENKTKLKSAFATAAQELGFGPDGEEKVMDLLQSLTRELCYIEALRERFLSVRNIAERLIVLRRLYSSDARVKDEIRCIGLLLGKAIQEYEKIFFDVDAQTSEIIGALKSIDRQIKYIRQRRDELHYIMRVWDPIIGQWSELKNERSRAMDKVLTATYRLLAPRFTISRSMRAA
ncbi:MAG: hypothetical protein JNM81_15405 [Rhodospirillaceae bacterium]|nr:hypothetical protein [Rhodospirillaceae bacterium]